MTSRHIIITLLCSVFSALLAIALSKWLMPATSVVVREISDAQFANNKDWLEEIRPRTFLSTSPTDFSSAAEIAISSVVSIRAIQNQSASIFQRSHESSIASTGSGVIVSRDGFIITNNHVVEGGSTIEVVLNDKHVFEASIVGVDPSTDLALLKIKANRLKAIELGNSDSLRIGEWVLAIGNPFNLESTVTAGIISAKGRNIDILEGQDRIESFIQTDAVVNPGNSGGALVNTNGELVGINTAIITKSGGYEGYSFAIPSNLVRKIIKDLSDFGVVQRGLLGVFIEDISAATADDLGLDEITGVLITRISEDSGAENAGLLAGDVIIAINGQETKSASFLQEILGQLRPGNKVRLKYIRNGVSKQTTIILKNKINSTSTYSAKEEKLLHDCGFELRNLSSREKNRLQTNGVKVISVFRGSKVGATNMEPGFIITHLNDKKIDNVKDLLDAIKRNDDELVLEGVYENYEGEYFYSFIK